MRRSPEADLLLIGLGTELRGPKLRSWRARARPTRFSMIGEQAHPADDLEHDSEHAEPDRTGRPRHGLQQHRDREADEREAVEAFHAARVPRPFPSHIACGTTASKRFVGAT